MEFLGLRDVGGLQTATEGNNLVGSPCAQLSLLKLQEEVVDLRREIRSEGPLLHLRQVFENITNKGLLVSRQHLAVSRLL